MKKPVYRFRANDGSEFPDWTKIMLGKVADITKLAGFEFTEYVKYEDSGSIIALRGLNVKNGNVILDDVKYIDGSDLSKLKRSKLYKGDILYTYIGTIGEAAIILENDKYYLAPNVALIRVNSINEKYLLQYLYSYSLKSEVNKYITTTSQPALTMENLRKFNINMPCVEEQKKIASLLSAIDKKISLFTDLVENLKQLKNGYMQKIFSQKMQFKDDNGGDYPAWEKKKLENISENVVGGGTPDTKITEFYNGDIPWISSSDIEKDNVYKISKTRFITKKAIELSATKLIPKNSVLIVSRVGVGKVAIADEDLCTSQDFTNMVLKEGYNSVFIAYLICKTMRQQLNYIQGTSIKGITGEEIRKIKIEVPCLKEQNKIAYFLSALDKKIKLTKEKLESAKEFKKGLMQKMFV